MSASTPEIASVYIKLSSLMVMLATFAMRHASGDFETLYVAWLAVVGTLQVTTLAASWNTTTFVARIRLLQLPVRNTAVSNCRNLGSIDTEQKVSKLTWPNEDIQNFGEDLLPWRNTPELTLLEGNRKAQILKGQLSANPI